MKMCGRRHPETVRGGASQPVWAELEDGERWVPEEVTESPNGPAPRLRTTTRAL